MKKSIWQNTTSPSHFLPAPQEDHVDVAIIGGGITGITTASLLKDCGFSVGVFEGGRIANSNTGKSTGNLYMLVDTPLQELSKKYPLQTIEEILKARKDALDLIESHINKYQIKCSFKRVPWTLYSGVAQMDEFVEKEFELAGKLNLSPQWINESDESLKVIKGRVGFKILNQAQFDPFTYVHDLAKKINSPKCRIYENTKIHSIKDGDTGHILKSENSTIYAKTVIHATHTPLGFSPLQTIVAPYREYGIAKKMKELPFEDAIYWGYFENKSMHSFRRHGDYIMMIGCPHKVGQADSKNHYEELRKTFDQFDLSQGSSETIEWSGQNFRSSDELPFIGEGFEKNTLMCTGFATDGLVYGTLSAMIFKDILLNNKNTYKDIFKPHRVRSIGSKKFISENINVLEQYVVDYFKSSPTEHPEAGEGKILSYKGQKYAVTKDDKGDVQVCSAVCTHLGCIVHWNSAEKSWDCPCHGSRFNHKGETLEGPALKDLGEKLKEDLL